MIESPRPLPHSTSELMLARCQTPFPRPLDDYLTDWISLTDASNMTNLLRPGLVQPTASRPHDTQNTLLIKVYALLAEIR